MSEARRRPRVRRGTAPTLLLEAARQLFAERGYQGATTRQIADLAGVSEDLIFRYYGTKQGLLTESVLRPLMEAIDEVARQWTDNDLLRDCPDEELIRWFVVSLYGLLEDNRTVARAMTHLLSEGSNEPEFEQLRDKFSGLFEPLVASFGFQLKTRGLHRSDVALQLRLIMVQIASAAVFLPATYRDGELPARETVIDEIVAAILNGLRISPRS